MRQSKVVTVSIPPKLLKQAERLAQKEQRTKSEVVRDALRLYLNLQNDKGFRLAVRERARALHLQTEEDIERVVDAVRK
jgi:CopG family transcriptional regulator/antitoxin EndoAI